MSESFQLCASEVHNPETGADDSHSLHQGLAISEKYKSQNRKMF